MVSGEGRGGGCVQEDGQDQVGRRATYSGHEGSRGESKMTLSEQYRELMQWDHAAVKEKFLSELPVGDPKEGRDFIANLEALGARSECLRRQPIDAAVVRLVDAMEGAVWYLKSVGYDVQKDSSAQEPEEAMYEDMNSALAELKAALTKEQA